MFVPICICALDPGLYKNVKHFRFILGLLLFLTNEKEKEKKNTFPIQSDPKDLKRYFFFTHLKNNQIKSRFVCVCLDRIFRKSHRVSCP